jgi:hypothetical protein
MICTFTVQNLDFGVRHQKLTALKGLNLHKIRFFWFKPIIEATAANQFWCQTPKPQQSWAADVSGPSFVHRVAIYLGRLKTSGFHA